MGLAKSTVSRVVTNLVERGWAAREPASDDGRGVRLTLTDAGRDAADRLSGARRQRMEALLEQVPIDRRSEVVDVLRRCRRRLMPVDRTVPTRGDPVPSLPIVDPLSQRARCCPTLVQSSHAGLLGPSPLSSVCHSGSRCSSVCRLTVSATGPRRGLRYQRSGPTSPFSGRVRCQRALRASSIRIRWPRSIGMRSRSLWWLDARPADQQVSAASWAPLPRRRFANSAVFTGGSDQGKVRCC